MSRARLTKRKRERIFEDAGRRCAICGFTIQLPHDAWALDHRKPLHLGGEDTTSNLVPVHTACHERKSAAENTVRAKCDRVRAKHLGIKKTSKPIPGAKKSKWKKTFKGWVLRDPPLKPESLA